MLGVNLRGEMTVLDTYGEGNQSKLIDLPLLDRMKECMRISSEEVG